MNTNTSVNSESTTAETSRDINSEISSQMSWKLEEVRIDLNAHVLEAINSAIEEQVLSTIQNAVNTHSAKSNAKLDLRSYGPHQRENGGMSRKTQTDVPNTSSTKTIYNKTPAKHKEYFPPFSPSPTEP